MQLHTMKPRPGSRHRTKRLGIGESSGHGKTSGKGHKGQKARSGGSIRLGFEGGQMPLIRRLPKRGFNNANFKKNYAIVNLDDLNDFADGVTIDETALLESNLIRGKYFGVKILARGEITKKIIIEADKVTDAARVKIEALGGSITLRPAKKVAVKGVKGVKIVKTKVSKTDRTFKARKAAAAKSAK